MADFRIHSSTACAGIALIEPMHEDALAFLEDECKLHVMNNGAAPLDKEAVGDFISDAASVWLEAEYL